MKILLHYPKWGNRWEPYILDALSGYDLTVTDTMNAKELTDLSLDKDVLLSMWCNQAVGHWSQTFPDKKIVTFLRRFELWSDTFMRSIDFSAVDAMIFVSEYYADTFHRAMQANVDHVKFYIIPNGINLDEWQPQNGKADPHKIALVASMKHVKNIPLAAMILKELPPAYHIHHIGLHAENFTGELFSYIDYLGVADRWHWDPKLEPGEVQGWLQDKAMILNPSINEGNPNCVIEAMAMGIKPVIHSWPGSYDEFPEKLIFQTIPQACFIIKNDEHEPEKYRDWIKERFSASNFEQLKTVMEEL